jgi:hypothetical protein
MVTKEAAAAGPGVVTMVSNLLVVLCSEQATQPVVNTGTLCQ